MSDIFGRRLRVASLVAVVMLVMSALTISGPLKSLVGVFMIMTSFPAYFVSAMVANNIHNDVDLVFYVGVFVQWFALGYVAAMVGIRRA